MNHAERWQLTVRRPLSSLEAQRDTSGHSANESGAPLTPVELKLDAQIKIQDEAEARIANIPPPFHADSRELDDLINQDLNLEIQEIKNEAQKRIRALQNDLKKAKAKPLILRFSGSLNLL